MLYVLDPFNDDNDLELSVDYLAYRSRIKTSQETANPIGQLRLTLASASVAPAKSAITGGSDGDTLSS